MIDILLMGLGAAVAAGAGGVFVAWRLKGERSWREVGVVILGGGPGNPTTPV